MSTRRPLIWWSLVHLIFVFVVRVAAAESAHLRMGAPEYQASSAPASKNDVLLIKDNYALSYNNQKGTPNWVSWRLSKAELGNAPRKPFKADESLSQGSKVIEPKDYTNSGFDRGHMCPHSDRSKNVPMSASTFLMTNMVPQSPQLNQKAWAQLELYCRDLVAEGDKVCYVVSGPAGRGGIGRNGFKTWIGPDGHKVLVPAQCWKLILVIGADKDDPAKVDDEARLISVIMPNDDSLGQEWAEFRVPADEIEGLTDLVFFNKVATSVMEPLKSEADEEPIAQPTPIIHGH